jgi:hypothetical protein
MTHTRLPYLNERELRGQHVVHKEYQAVINKTLAASPNEGMT